MGGDPSPAPHSAILKGVTMQYGTVSPVTGCHEEYPIEILEVEEDRIRARIGLPGVHWGYVDCPVNDWATFSYCVQLTANIYLQSILN